MMKRHVITYIAAAAVIFLMSACAKELPVDVGGDQALELEDLVPVLSRAGGVPVADLKDYVGRDEFDNADRAVFVRIKRTLNPIPNFNYRGIEFVCSKTVTDDVVSIGWSRDKSKGRTEGGGAETAPDRIYWSDATNEHTFTGYCAPQQGTGEFDWEEVGSAYYGSIGDPTATGEGSDVIDFRSVYTDDVLVKSGNVELRKNDILLTHATDIKANDAIANLKFYHGLAQVRVIVSISDFAASDKRDKESVVSDMLLKDMLTMYKWREQSVATEQLADSDQSIIDGIYTGGPSVLYNQRKDVKLWIPAPLGDGTGSSKTFTFYGLAVPTSITSPDKLDFSFTVTYPDPMHPETPISHTYAASISDIRFDAGKCTTINVSLNHMNEKITVGAEYDDWDFIASPDEGELVKLSTFLKPSDLTNVTIHTDPTATEEDATWLYVSSGGDILDIYGHTGDEDDPYLIKTATQFLSFAKEVNAGFDFEGKFVTLDAGIILQPDYSSSSVVWPGIGIKGATSVDDRPFNGWLFGGVRLVKRLKGKPLFGYIGPLGHVEQLNLEDVLEVDGPSAFVYQNDGIICASKVSGVYGQSFSLTSVAVSGLKKDETDNWSSIDWTGGDDAGTTTVAAPFAAINNGVLMACYCTGNFTSTARRNSGIVGYNNGAMVVDYSGNKCTSSAPDPFYRGTVAYNRYNPDFFIEHPRPNESTGGATVQGSNFNICLKKGDPVVYTKKHAIILEVGDDSDVLVATARGEDRELDVTSWAIGSSSIATFDSETGKLHAVAVGETKLTATSGGKTEYLRVVVVRKALRKLGTHYGALTYCFYDKTIANNVNSGYNFGDVFAKTTAEMQSPTFIGDKDPSNVNPATLNGNLHYWSQHSELCPDIILAAYEEMLHETPDEIDRALSQLCTHFLGRYYVFHVGSYPWVY